MALAAEIVRKPRRGATTRLTIAVAVFLAAALPAWGVYALYAHQEDLRRSWGALGGPACPIATHTWKQVALHRDPHHFTYGHAKFGHLFGGADCASVPDGPFITRRAYYVCQFSDPVMLSVTVGDRTVTYEPGWSRPATVRIRNGQPACAVAGWAKAG